MIKNKLQNSNNLNIDIVDYIKNDLVNIYNIITLIKLKLTMNKKQKNIFYITINLDLIIKMNK